MFSASLESSRITIENERCEIEQYKQEIASEIGNGIQTGKLERATRPHHPSGQ